MITENLSTLKIHKLTQDQYDRELAAGNIDPNALYLTPDEQADLSGYATLEQLDRKANVSHNHDDIYEKKVDADTKFAEAKTYTDTEIDKVKSTIRGISEGTIVVGEAEFAEKAALDANGNSITDTYETKSDASAKLTEAKEYAATYTDNAVATVKNDLLNGAGAAYDSLKELGDLIDENTDAIEALKTIASGKANTTHSHAMAEVTGLIKALDDASSAIRANTNSLETHTSEIENINTKTIDKILQIDTWHNGAINTSVTDTGVVWYDEFGLIYNDDNNAYTGEISQKIPIVAGDNISLVVDSTNRVVKINVADITEITSAEIQALFTANT